jgi:hypothetical protein
MRGDRGALALIVALVVAAFANVVFGGKSLSPSENFNPLDYRFTERNYGPGFVPPEEWTSRDLVPYANYRDPSGAWRQGEPSAELLRRSLARGEFPFWDPYVGGGMPSFATMVPAYLFPPSVLVVILGNGSLVRNLYVLLLVVAAGALTYKLLRARGVSWHGAVAGGMAFAFSGAVIQTVPSFFGQPVALFSLPLLLTARLLDAPSPRRAAQLAFGFAFVALATVPPMLAQIFGACVLYALVAAAFAPAGGRLPAVSWFAGGAAAALGIAAVAYVPALAVMRDSPQVSAYYEHAALEKLAPSQLAQLLSPTIAGGSAIYANPAIAGPTSLHLYYTGVVALLLSAIGLLAAWRSETRVLVITVAIAGGLSLAKLFGVPPVEWISQVPGLRTVHYGAYFGILVAYAVALLAGLGVDALIAGRARLWNVLAGGAALALALAVVRIAAARSGVSFRPEGWRWIADFRLLVLFSVIAIAAALLAVRSPRRATLAATLLIGVLAVEAVTNSFYPRQQRWEVWRHPPAYVEAISKAGSFGRVLPIAVYQANAESVFGHPTLDSLTLFSSPRVFALYRRYFNPATTQFLRETDRIPPDGVLDAANIEFLVVVASEGSKRAEATARGYRSIYQDELVEVFRRQTTPRYSFTSSYRVAPAEQALAALGAGDRRGVWVEEKPSFPSLPESKPGPPPRVRRFGLNSVELEVEAPRAGFLVCSESHMRGWSATIDGRPARLQPANYAFRALAVPPGRHVVSLQYHPPGLPLGALVSLMAIALCATAWWRSPAAPRPAA